ncbi:hypothetical protein SO802_007936 [Lithocarpus litseifolius]|uniref:Cytochrome P450 n=1 Tax=Lithocarpus litseifolius TaxID=425828 RepID=A0AAW2DQD1_9ROSI
MQMALEFGAKQLISYDSQQSSENITDFYFSLLRTLMSFPLNIPGTAYHKCMKEERSPGDFLDTVIRDMKVEDFKTVEFVVQMLFGLLLAMPDTISIMTTLTLKLLDDYPHVLEQLIVKSNVVNEVLRLGNFAPGMFRRTLRDVQVNGYTIPSGWPILIATPALHLNSEIFNDPLAFNPQRFKLS